MADDPMGASGFAAAAHSRQHAMNALMWSERDARWRDVDWASGQQQTSTTSVSDWMPLWAGFVEPNSRRARRAVASLKASGLVQRAGVATTLTRSEHQWDWPNAWAPIQEALIDGLEASGTAEGRELALEIARNWIASNMEAYSRTHYMYEKYSATEMGARRGMVCTVSSRPSRSLV